MSWHDICLSSSLLFLIEMSSVHCSSYLFHTYNYYTEMNSYLYHRCMKPCIPLDDHIHRHRAMGTQIVEFQKDQLGGMIDHQTLVHIYFIHIVLCTTAWATRSSAPSDGQKRGKVTSIVLRLNHSWLKSYFWRQMILFSLYIAVYPDTDWFRLLRRRSKLRQWCRLLSIQCSRLLLNRQFSSCCFTTVSGWSTAGCGSGIEQHYVPTQSAPKDKMSLTVEAELPTEQV